MKKLFTLLISFLFAATLCAQRFQVGDLFYEIPSEDFTIPAVSSPGAGRTTVVLYVPWNTPAGCYAVGSFDWNDQNTERMFTPVEGASSKRWVACTFDYAEDMQIKVLALPSDPAIAPSWSFQWGKNMDPENDLVEDNVVILEGAGSLELENQGQPKLVELEDNGVVYIEIKDWAANPIIESVPCETAAFKHPWGDGYYWTYREATKTADATFELNARYGGVGISVATDVYGYCEIWYPEDQIELVGDVAQGDSVNFKFISEKSTFVGRMIVTLIEKGTGSNDEYWYVPSKKSSITPQKRSSEDSPRQVVVTYQHAWSSNNYANLTAANIPETVEYRGVTYEVIGIGSNAFANSPLMVVSIPSTVKYIGYEAFANCSSLLKTNYMGDLTGWCDIDFEGWYSNPMQYSHNLYLNNTELKGTVVIPEGVDTIHSFSFISGHNITSVSIPNSVTSIGSYAFAGCSSLTSITIPNSITSIGSSAFEDCSSLTSVTIPNSVTSIGSDAFYHCSSLTSVTIGNSVTSIEDAAFYGCSSLTSITIPDNVTYLGEGVFVHCLSLEYLSIPNSVKYYDEEDEEDGYTYRYYYGGFASILNCPKLKTLIVPADFFGIGGNEEDYQYAKSDLLPYLPEKLESLTINGGNMDHRFGWDFINRNRKSLKHIDFGATESIAEEAFTNYYNLESLVLPSQLETVPYMAVAECVKLKSISIPATVTEIEDRAFENCRMLSSVTFAKNGALTRIGNWAFYNNHELTNIVIPEGVTEVGHAAFYDCTYLKEMTLPSTMQTIADNAFSQCQKVSKITVNATTPPVVEPKTFEDIDRNIPLYVPAGTASQYKQADYWCEFFNVIEQDALSSVENLNAPSSTTNTQKLLRDGQLLILKDGKTYNAMGQEM